MATMTEIPIISGHSATSGSSSGSSSIGRPISTASWE
jgi:hypothetical protein